MSTATKLRIIQGLAVLLMFTPTLLYFAGPLRKPPMFEGDKLVESACLACSGTGEVEGESCEECYGEKTQEYIYPGPNRPTTIIAHVSSALNEEPIEGAQAVIRVIEEGKQGEPMEYRTESQGRFGSDLPPGRYLVSVSAEGHQTVSKEIEVDVITTPRPANKVPTLEEMPLKFSLPFEVNSQED